MSAALRSAGIRVFDFPLLAGIERAQRIEAIGRAIYFAPRDGMTAAGLIVEGDRVSGSEVLEVGSLRVAHGGQGVRVHFRTADGRHRVTHPATEFHVQPAEASS